MSWTQNQIKEVWDKAEKVSGNNEQNGFRKDQCTAWIRSDDYGNRNSKYGWEIDHIKAQSNNGGDNISNLRPLHWKNNAARQNDRLKKIVYSAGAKNIDNDTGRELVI